MVPQVPEPEPEPEPEIEPRGQTSPSHFNTKRPSHLHGPVHSDKLEEVWLGSIPSGTSELALGAALADAGLERYSYELKKMNLKAARKPKAKS